MTTPRSMLPDCPWHPAPGVACAHCDDPHAMNRAALFALSQRENDDRALLAAYTAIGNIEDRRTTWAQEARRMADTFLLSTLVHARVLYERHRQSRAVHLYMVSIGAADRADTSYRAAHHKARARLAALTAEASERIATYERAARSFRRAMPRKGKQ